MPGVRTKLRTGRKGQVIENLDLNRINEQDQHGFINKFEASSRGTRGCHRSLGRLSCKQDFRVGPLRYERMRERQNYNEGSVTERNDRNLPVRVV